MKCVVIYASRTGNTRTIAEAIAAGLRPRGTVEMLSVADAPTAFAEGTDLVIIGGPTEAHGMTEQVTRFLDRLEPGALQGKAAAGFDTRLRWPRFLSGSAAAGITERLRRSGARVMAPAESFIVNMKPLLEPGEAERAEAWAAWLADRLEAKTRPFVGSTA